MDSKKNEPPENTQINPLQMSTSDESSDVSEDKTVGSSTLEDVICSAIIKEYGQNIAERQVDAASSKTANIDYFKMFKMDLPSPLSPLKDRERDDSSEEDSTKSPEKKFKLYDSKINEGASKAGEQNFKIPIAIPLIKLNVIPQKTDKTKNKEITETMDIITSTSSPVVHQNTQSRALIPIESRKAFEAKSCSDVNTERPGRFISDILALSPIARSIRRDNLPLLNVEQQIDQDSVPLLLKKIDNLKQDLQEIIELGNSPHNMYRKQDYIDQSKKIQKNIEECFMELEERILLERTQRQFNRIEVRRKQRSRQQPDPPSRYVKPILSRQNQTQLQQVPLAEYFIEQELTVQQQTQKGQSPPKEQHFMPLQQQLDEQQAVPVESQHIISLKEQIPQSDAIYAEHQIQQPPVTPKQQCDHELHAIPVYQQMLQFLPRKQQALLEQDVSVQCQTFPKHLSVEKQSVLPVNQNLQLRQKIVNLFTLFHYLSDTPDVSFSNQYLQDHLNRDNLKALYGHFIKCTEDNSRGLKILKIDLRDHMNAAYSDIIKTRKELNCGVIATDITTMNDMINFNQLLKEKMYENKDLICSILDKLKKTNVKFKKFTALARKTRYEYFLLCSKRRDDIFI